MARRKTRSAGAGIGSDIVVVNAAPPARRSGGGGIRRRRSSGGSRRRRRSGGKGAGASIQTRIQRTALGGLGYGMVRKHFPDLPTVAGLGRAGTVAAAIYFLKPSSQLLQDIGIAAAAIAGASFGETGTVSGHGDAEDEVLSNG